MISTRGALLILSPLVVLMLALCSTFFAKADFKNPHPMVVASTPIIADMVEHIAGDIPVRTLIPPNADTHSYEPPLSAIRDIANAQLIFTNGLLLEDQSINRAIDNHKNPAATTIALAEQLGRQGNAGYLLPMVENRGQDTIWLGLKVIADISNAHQVRLRLSSIDGPGSAHAFIIGTFGEPQEILNTSGAEALLPANAHTHVSWAFTKPGNYRLDLIADLVDYKTGAHIADIASGSLHFNIASTEGLHSGHQDLTINTTTNELEIRGDGPTGHNHRYDLDTVISVPPLALTEVPADPAYRFLGRPGEPIYLLQQAVLGKHVHGELDPHVWLDPDNATAMVDIIARTLAHAYPARREEFFQNSENYKNELHQAAKEIRSTVARIKPEHRYLATTHDAYSYFAHAYQLNIAGFISPATGLEPQPAALQALSRNLIGLGLPAVFLEPVVTPASTNLKNIAQPAGVKLCTLYGDSFAPTPGLVALYYANAHALTCLI
ncbi:MAG: anchored repeat ABC transporter, substrate-binding protein [Corynebacterium sp.]|nr:anchored repeat ABC transporter, substrate-binding protein [Corynebacterium sp.]